MWNKKKCGPYAVTVPTRPEKDSKLSGKLHVMLAVRTQLLKNGQMPSSPFGG